MKLTSPALLALFLSLAPSVARAQQPPTNAPVPTTLPPNPPPPPINVPQSPPPSFRPPPPPPQATPLTVPNAPMRQAPTPNAPLPNTNAPLPNTNTPNANAPQVSVADPLAAALAPQPNGLTADSVANVAAQTRHSVRGKQAELRAAAARVDQALVNYFPRLSLTASYTRLSPVNNVLPGAILGTANPGNVTVGACPGGMGQCVLDSGGLPAQAEALSFPSLQNNYSIVATLSVPISDYVFRIAQGYSSAVHAEKGKKLELEAEQLAVAADGRIAFFNWVRAKGQTVVAKQAVDQASAHVEEAKKSFAVGRLSKVDLLRLDAQVAAAQQLQAQADAQEAVAAEQLRTVLGVPPSQPLVLGADVMHDTTTPPPEALDALESQALANRLEIRALDESIYSLKEQISVAKATAYPRIDAFGDVTYANPNQRIFPQVDHWDATWDLGVRLSYAFNDTFTGLAAGAQAKAQKEQVEEQKGTLRDGLRLEVANAYAAAKQASVSIDAAERQLAATEEAMRVRLELFKNGNATSVDLIDAEVDVTRARLARINARVDILVARARLDHAIGRDAKTTNLGASAGGPNGDTAKARPKTLLQ